MKDVFYPFFRGVVFFLVGTAAFAPLLGSTALLCGLIGASLSIERSSAIRALLFVTVVSTIGAGIYSVSYNILLNGIWAIGKLILSPIGGFVVGLITLPAISILLKTLTDALNSLYEGFKRWQEDE
jgi:hypothetical protein